MPYCLPPGPVSFFASAVSCVQVAGGPVIPAAANSFLFQNSARSPSPAVAMPS